MHQLKVNNTEYAQNDPQKGRSVMFYLRSGVSFHQRGDVEAIVLIR